MRRLARRLGKRQGNHAFRHIARKGGMRDGRVLSRSRPSAPHLHEPLLPAPDGSLCYARRAHDLGRAAAVARQEHDLCPPNVFLWAVAVGHDGEQTFAVARRDIDSDPGAHTPIRMARRVEESVSGLFRQVLSSRCGRHAWRRHRNTEQVIFPAQHGHAHSAFAALFVISCRPSER